MWILGAIVVVDIGAVCLVLGVVVVVLGVGIAGIGTCCCLYLGEAVQWISVAVPIYM